MNKLAFYSLLSLGGTSAYQVYAAQTPNVIIIYMDDMGYADISCYGQKKWKTPHIDKLAEEGMRFTDAYSASSISSPSRAALLTGRYPARMGMNLVFFPDSYTGIPKEEVLLPELLKSAGYYSAVIGKWHLGHRERFLPLQKGFDEYFGIPYSNDMTAQVYLRGNEVEEFHIDQSQTVKRYTHEAVGFIERNKERPFFLYLAHNMMHVPIYCSDEFKGKSGAGLYGDAVLEVDWSVGQVMQALSDNGLLENTLVIFSSDNGPWLQEGPLGGEALPLREGKGTSYEGGVRVPAIACWKGKIQPRVYEDIICTLDWFPTIATLCKAAVPDTIRLDGTDITNVLLNKGIRSSNTYAYFRHNEEVTGIRVGDWKLSLPEAQINGNFWRASTAAHDTLLFNLREDPSETTNLRKKYPRKAEELARALDEYKRNFGEVPKPMSMYHSNQLGELERQRRKAVEDARKRGVESKSNQIDGFIELE